MLNQHPNDSRDASALKNELQEHTGGAAKVEKHMICKDCEFCDLSDCRPYGPQSPFDTRLSRRSKLLTARAAVKAVYKSARKLVFKRLVLATMLKHTVDATITDFSGRLPGHSHQASAVLLVFRS